MTFEPPGHAEPIDDNRAVLLIELEAGGYLTEEQAARVTQRLRDAPAELPDTDSPRKMLDWLIAEGYTTADAEAKATHELLDGCYASGNAKIFLMTVLEEIDPPRFEQRRNETIASMQREQKKKQMLIGFGGLAAALAVGAYLLWPASAPACGASSTTKALNSLLFDARRDMMRRNPMQMLDRGTKSFPHVSNPREVGYDEANRARGCLADVSIADEHATLGYVVRHDDKDKSAFVVQTFSPEYVTARYSAQGLDPKLGAPLGRDVISAAFMASVAQLDKDVSARMPRYGKPRFGDDTPTTLTSSVFGVMPAADCKPIDGDRVSCPLLIDYRDRLLGAIGAPSMLQLKGDFTFVKEGSGWKAADDFDKTLMEAIVARRVAKVYGDDVADKMEAEKK
ncbi:MULTISPECIES: hypothetical protein [Burkholderia]|uniref:Uncharacterized protein n=1 Tax=Burkholderia contaminans TaxID=488447 RepID=A0A2S5E2M9_9BURK|nr:MULTISPECIES: hypothetical protein [Burkholderia]EKS9794512.1 hypothetical protein [Burkholderia cepacia]EKS9801687.1 hypothetical protein [Burkholderia cepacia]EKS9811305.1 hypothetical protein [Burkholderia cepacia]EKS9817195.1 hypothetical protein [Burkholderia cepacia]EKS9824700.1 hypothetical protein [Burkholderia cepacia]